MVYSIESEIWNHYKKIEGIVFFVYLFPQTRTVGAKEAAGLQQ